MSKENKSINTVVFLGQPCLEECCVPNAFNLPNSKFLRPRSRFYNIQFYTCSQWYTESWRNHPRLQICFAWEPGLEPRMSDSIRSVLNHHIECGFNFRISLHVCLWIAPLRCMRQGFPSLPLVHKINVLKHPQGQWHAVWQINLFYAVVRLCREVKGLSSLVFLISSLSVPAVANRLPRPSFLVYFGTNTVIRLLIFIFFQNIVTCYYSFRRQKSNFDTLMTFGSII